MSEIGQIDLEGHLLRNEDGPWGTSGREGPASDGGGGLGPRNPWTEPPAVRKGQDRKRPLPGPAVEALLRRGRERFGGRLPEPRDRSFWLGGIVSLLMIWVLITSFHRIDPAERGVVLRLGRYEGTLSPGLHMTLPAPIDAVEKLPVEQVSTTDIGASAGDNENLAITSDGNLVDLAYVVRWKIADPKLFLFENKAPEDLIREAAENAMRSEVARATSDQVTGAEQGAVADRAAQRLQATLSGYRAGVQVVGIAIRKASPPAALADTIKSVVDSAQKAQAEASAAKLYALQAADKAQRETADFAKVFDQYRLAPQVTRQRMYFDMMDEVLPRVDKTIVDAPGVSLPVTTGSRIVEEEPKP